MNIELLQAQSADLERLAPLVRAYHAFEKIESSEATRRAALRRLLSDSALGAVYLVQADGDLAGYIALCRGFSIEFNGFDAFVDEFYLEPEYRGLGVGGRTLELIRQKARELEINALHLEVARDNERARRLYTACGFEAREKYLLMSADLVD